MKLYKEVLIASSEQAEALPVGTVLTQWPYQPTLVTEYDGRRHYGAPGTASRSAHAVGWTALVPIEAEEEWALIYDGEEPTLCADEADARDWARIDGEGQAPSRRFTTPWEEAQ